MFFFFGIFIIPTLLADVFHGPSEDQKLYWHWPQPQPISMPAFAWKCRSAWSRKPRWIQCVVCRNANSRREPFCFLIDAPKQSQTHFFVEVFIFCFLFWFDWSWGVYAFQWPAKNTRIWIRAEQKEALPFLVVSCFCQSFFLIEYPLGNDRISLLWRHFEVDDFFPFSVLVLYVCLFPGG